MRAILLAGVGVLAFAGAADAAAVRGYIKRDGTYVAPSYRSRPNSTTLDNYSTRGNVNPYTGKTGTQQPTFGYTPPRTYVPPIYTPTPTYRAPSYGSSYGR